MQGAKQRVVVIGGGRAVLAGSVGLAALVKRGERFNLRERLDDAVAGFNRLQSVAGDTLAGCVVRHGDSVSAALPGNDRGTAANPCYDPRLRLLGGGARIESPPADIEPAPPGVGRPA